MFPNAVNQIVWCVAIGSEDIGVTEDGFISVCTRPVKFHPGSGGDVDASNLNRASGDATVAQERVVDSQNLVDRSVQLGVANPGAEPVLQCLVGRQVVKNHSDAEGD